MPSRDLKSLRLLIDARMAYHGGIGTYVRHLVSALRASGAVTHCCVAGAPDGAWPDDHGTLCRHPLAVPLYSLAEWLMNPANPHGAQLWHSPHFNAPRRWPGPLVVTIHDLIPAKHPLWTRVPWATPYAVWRLQWAAHQADALIAVSETTKRAFCEWADVAPERVTVIPHGVSSDMGRPIAPDHQARILAAYGVRPPFILWVSAVRPHKNPLVVLRAFAALRAQHRIPHQLVMVGHRPTWYSVPRREAVRLGIETAIRWIESVPTAVLPALYQAARVLVMPSYEEGFGLPVLEAMAAGLPVLVSTAPALLELIENAGVAIEPDDVDGWREHLYTVAFNDERHRHLQQQGRDRAAPFTWARTAGRHLDVYRAVAHAAPAR